MLSRQLSYLNEEEKNILLDSIVDITLLIAGADGKIDSNEIEWAEKITNIRTYKHDDQLQDFYETIGADFNDKLNSKIAAAPKDKDERTQYFSNRLSQLGPILEKLEIEFARELYSSLKSFAKHVAKSSGGFLDYASIGFDEYELVQLPMIDFDPTRNTKGL